LKSAGVDAALIKRVVSELRRRWGGASEYIQRHDRQARDEAIKSGLNNGQAVNEVAKAVECSPRTIRRKRSQWL
jgi:Mor family transcriptional regulator